MASSIGSGFPKEQARIKVEEAFRELLDFVDARLPRRLDGSPDMEREQSDVVHDLLAFLAEEMTGLHKEKQKICYLKQALKWLEAKEATGYI